MTTRWEKDWIRGNPHYYDSKGHLEAVILNIEKRLVISELQKEIDIYKKELKID